MVYEEILQSNVSEFNKQCEIEMKRLCRMTVAGVSKLPRTPFVIGQYIDDIAASPEKEPKIKSLLAQISSMVPLDEHYKSLYSMIYLYYNCLLNDKLSKDEESKLRVLIAATTFKRSGVSISRVLIG